MIAKKSPRRTKPVFHNQARGLCFFENWSTADDGADDDLHARCVHELDVRVNVDGTMLEVINFGRRSPAARGSRGN